MDNHALCSIPLPQTNSSPFLPLEILLEAGPELHDFHVVSTPRSNMETTNCLEKKSPKEKNCRCYWIVCILISFFLLTLVLVLFCIVRCFTHPAQTSDICWVHATWPSNSTGIVRWKWNMTNCSNSVQNITENNHDMLEILQDGLYFVYSSVHHLNSIDDDNFTIMLHSKNYLLDKVTGPNCGDTSSTISFGRPHLLKKGERLYLLFNNNLMYISRNITYWGLFRMH
ncbi:uncharacterized protein LOC112551649 isoform X1 [Alligator sinensis]|uniref:Uncharacterized protein LOC112551649 isoform X1 n=1 Tax=Alligator sinensis TaxID=38654 RepID=A0A3Q0HCN0_ALLSI|nr:uncharacterized protein LOC112551649 isoform X1 [Alligator sinensis]